MWARGHTHWYIGELAMLRSGKLIIPQAWFRHVSGGEVYGEGFEVEVETDRGESEVCFSSIVHDL